MSMRIKATTWLVAGFFTVLTIGCSGNEKDDKDKKRPREKPEEVQPPEEKPTSALKPIQGKGVATFTGTVKLVGDPPDTTALTNKLLAEFDKAVADKPVCLMGSEAEKSQYSWIIKDGKVNNVFVWVRPIDDKSEFFDVKALVEQGKGWDKVKVIDQPHCAFEPHALILFPRYVDPAKPSTNWRVPGDKGGPPTTGQEFVVKNSSVINHNTSTSGDTSRMRGVNTAIPPKGQLSINDIQPSYRSAVDVRCSVHPWMKSVVWAFEHPFASISGSKAGESPLESGQFKIENIPAGVKLRVVAWHEEAGFLNGGEKGEEITFKEGENKKDFTISYKK